MAAAEHPRPGAVERQGDDRERGRRDHADARGEPVDAVDEVDHVHHGDEAEHGQDVAQLDVAEQDDVVEQHLVELDAAHERQGEVVHPDAAEDRDHRGDELPRRASRRRAGRRRRRAPPRRRSPRRRQGSPWSGAPRAGTGPRRPALRRGSPGRPAWASAPSCRLRSRGSSMAFSRRAAVSVRGTSSQAIDTATRKANRPSIGSGLPSTSIAVPGGEGIPRPRGLNEAGGPPISTVPRMRSTSSDGSRRVAWPLPALRFSSSSAPGSVSRRRRPERISASSTPPSLPAKVV